MQDDLQAMASSDGVSVHSGFPNPALDRRGQAAPLALNLNSLLVKHPSSTYLFRIAGHRWSDRGIYDGDVAVIDRAVEPSKGSLVIIWQDDSFNIYDHQPASHHERPWGVITSIIHQYS